MTTKHKKNFTQNKSEFEDVEEFPKINKIIDRKLAIPREVLNCFSFSSNREKFCDFIVLIDDYEFPCHRFVLNACSGFFEALFRSDMKEQREMKVTVHGISVDTFQLVLDVIYCASDVLSIETVLDVWKAAHQLQILFLISLCEEFVIENLNVDNWYPFYWHAPILASAKVIQFLNNYMISNFFDIANSDMFSNIQYEDLLNILKSQESTACMDFKISAIMKWCAASKVNGQFLGELIQVLDLSQASKQCLARLMTNEIVLSNQKAIIAVNKQAAQNLVNPANVYNTSMNANFHKYKRKKFDFQIKHISLEQSCPHCNGCKTFSW